MDAREAQRRVSEARIWLQKIVAYAGVSFLTARAVIERTVKELADEIHNETRCSEIISSFTDEIYSLLYDEIESSCKTATEKEGKDWLTWAALPSIFVNDKLNIRNAADRYGKILQEETDFFRESDYEAALFSRFTANPLSFEELYNGKTARLKSAISSVGSGVSYDLTKTLRPVTLTTAVTAYNLTLGEIWKASGVRMYQGFRNSTYDCPLCDSLCAEPHPIDDMVFPAHPRCVCGIYYIEEDV